MKNSILPVFTFMFASLLLIISPRFSYAQENKQETEVKTESSETLAVDSLGEKSTTDTEKQSKKIEQKEKPQKIEKQKEKANSKDRSTERINVSAGIGLPHPIMLSVGYRFIPQLAVFAELGNYKTTIDTYDVSIANSELGLMYYPFSGAFYLKASMGSHTIKATASEKITFNMPPLPAPITETVSAEVTVKASYQHLGLGWRWHPFSFLSMGMEYGVVAPSGASTSVETFADGLSSAAIELAKSTGDYQKMEKDIIDTGNTYGNTTLPKVALFTLGISF